MFCTKCGNQVKESAKFCSKCGAKVVVHNTVNNSASIRSTDDTTQKNNALKFVVPSSADLKSILQIDKNPIIFIAAGIAVVLATIIIVLIIVMTSNPFLKKIKNGFLTEHQNITIQKAFDGYFKHESWEEEKLGNGMQLAVFTGDFIYSPYWTKRWEIPVKAKFRFGYDANTGEIDIYDTAFTVIDKQEADFLEEKTYILNPSANNALISAIYRKDQYEYFFYETVEPTNAYNPEPQPITEYYQKSNKYNIPCSGNTDMAIEAANVFADKYGKNVRLQRVDASANSEGTGGTYRYTYLFMDRTITSTTTFVMNDYGSYRNYTWDTDKDIFCGE